MSKLTYAQRKSLPSSAFVFPKERKYPIHDIQHGRHALARGAQQAKAGYITKKQYALIRSAVKAKYGCAIKSLCLGTS